MTEISDQFWIENIGVLFMKDRLVEFFVTCDQTNAEKLNAIVRFGIYLSIVLSMYFNDPKYFGLMFVSFAFTYFVHKFSDKEQEKFVCNLEDGNINDKNIQKVYTTPTLNNPFMNPTMMDSSDKPLPFDYSENNEKSTEIKKQTKEAFEYNLYQDVGDLYSTNNSYRQFYTVPNDDPDGSFKDFLYGNIHSAKENTYNSYKNLYEPLQSKQSGRT